MGQKWAKNRVFKIYLKNYLNVWSIMKVYISCCILAQITYLGKFWLLKYGPKCFWPIRLQDF